MLIVEGVTVIDNSGDTTARFELARRFAQRLTS
jgi:hypothetical protein